MRWPAMMAAAAALAFAPAHAADRVALIVGNSAYATPGALPNTIGDAEAIEARLRELGFVNMLVTDATKAETLEAVDTFGEASKGAEIALFFYAGHGVQVNGANLLIPVDAKIDAARDLPGETVALDQLLAAANGAKVRIMLVDTSRNNPFAGSELPDLKGRAEPAGNTLVLFSTAPGSHAMDGPGANSPFVAALLKHLGTPGEEIAETARRIVREVFDATSGAQAPSYNSSLQDPVVLAK